MAEDNKPLTSKLMATSAAFGGAQPSSSGGSSVDDLLTQALMEAGIDPSNPTAVAEASGADTGSPLTWAAMSISQRMSVLPRWARDLKVLGMGATEEVPEMFVYMRDRKVPGTPENPTQFDTPQGFREGNDATLPTTKTQAETVTRALNQPYLWDEEELDEAMKRMQDAGLDVKTFDDVNDVWQGLVERAAKTYTFSKGEKKVTPWDVLDLVKREDEAANGGEDDENFTHVSTSKSIQDISEGEAWSVIQSNLSRMLGRDPSDQEVRDFTHRMNGLAARNPAISKTISTYKDGRLVNSTTREVESGFTADDMMKDAYDKAQADPEYGAFQAASTYYNAAVSALGAIGDV
jgi:hypothetical protein